MRRLARPKKGTLTWDQIINKPGLYHWYTARPGDKYSQLEWLIEISSPDVAFWFKNTRMHQCCLDKPSDGYLHWFARASGPDRAKLLLC